MRVAFLAVLAACGTSPEECRTYANDLGALLERAAEEPPPFLSVPDGIKLVERTDLPRRDQAVGPSVEINRTATWFHGEQLTASELSKALAKEHTEQHRLLAPDATPLFQPDEPPGVYFVIDASAPWPNVVEAFEAAMFAGMTKISFVFTAPQPLKPPPRAPIDERLDTILLEPAGSRAHEIAEVIKNQIKSCPGIGVAFEAVVARDSGNKAVQLAKVVPDALAHCACRVNMPNLRSTLFRLLYIPHPLRSLQLDPSQPATPIALPETATWADASKLLTPAIRNAEFTVARERQAR